MVFPGLGRIVELTCSSFSPVVTARARCTPPPAGSMCTHRVPPTSGPTGRGPARP